MFELDILLTFIFFSLQINAHLNTLQTCLTTLMGHSISMDQLKLDVGLMVEKMTQITIMFRRIKLRMEEYVCLKVYILLNRGELVSWPYLVWNANFIQFSEVELENIQERYVQVLRSYLQHTSPHSPGRLGELLAHIPEVRFDSIHQFTPQLTIQTPFRFKWQQISCWNRKCSTSHSSSTRPLRGSNKRANWTFEGNTTRWRPKSKASRQLDLVLSCK